MRRILLLTIACAIVAFAGWYTWKLSHGGWAPSATELLPRQTIFFAHMPDLNQARDQWHHSDISSLYREPAVQDFLRGAVANLPNGNAVAQSLAEIEQLNPKNVFLALTSMERNSPIFVGGFRFRGKIEDAERVIGKWRMQFLERNPGAKHEKIKYQRHEIDLLAATPFSLATAYNPPWFLAATDLTELKALLDRADHRGGYRNDNLAQDEIYRAAISHRPRGYALFFYLQPKTFAQRLAALRASVQSATAAKQSTLLEQMRAIFGTTKFEGGKIHDLVFLGMPKIEDVTLSRSSLTIGTRETFFYLSMLLNLGSKVDTFNQAAALGGATQRAFQALADAGITADDWKAAFGTELTCLADWPSSAQWPSLVLSLPVLNMAKAGAIVESLTHAVEDATWSETEKDGVRYFSKQAPASFIGVTPTIALSDHILLFALNPVSAENAIKRSLGRSSELADSQTYKEAVRLLPAPTNFFAYVDMVLLYSRLDALLRPMLLLGAALSPSIAGNLDLSKIPPPEVITKHLNPIVTSQRYDRDGYVVESIGPITLDQSLIGLAILSALGAVPRWMSGGLGSALTSPQTATPHPSSSPSPTP